MPSGSTSSRCLARPLCMPVSTYDPGLVVLLRTKKSPSLRRSFSALWRLISPWYQLCCSSSGRERRAERVSTGLQLSTDDALFNTDTVDDGDWVTIASSNGSAQKVKRCKPIFGIFVLWAFFLNTKSSGFEFYCKISLKRVHHKKKNNNTASRLHIKTNKHMHANDYTFINLFMVSTISVIVFVLYLFAISCRKRKTQTKIYTHIYTYIVCIYIYRIFISEETCLRHSIV